MSDIEFLRLDQVDHDDLMAILNEPSLRRHLIHHPSFDATRLQEWVEDKLGIDAIQGCRVRAVHIDGALAGWCGIQPDDQGFELAIVITRKHWGSGIRIFRSLMGWARELGHEEVLFHLLESRRDYKALNRIATRVHETDLAGRRFTTYHVPVGE